MTTKFLQTGILSVLCSIVVLHAQSFTAVHDTTDPVVTDQVESGGGTWFDANGDGYLDLFVANGNLSVVNNALYINDTKGSFIKVQSGAVVTDGGSSIGGTVGDFNGDGHPDLFVTNRQNFGNFLYTGTGDAALQKVTTGPPVTDIANSNSSSWVDLDGDGDLDLFTVNFQGNNFLYKNSGPPSYAFLRVDTGGIILDGSNFSIHGAWADYNNDRRPDLFIGNAGTQNDLLFTNTGTGAFTSTTLADGRATLGASWGDYDNDGDLDLFVANFQNQKSFLYRNSGAPSYSLVRIDTGIVCTDPGNSVGSVWADFDNDGDLDLFVANDGQNNFLYRNSGYPDYAFTKIVSGPIVNDGGNSFGSAAADYDNDGDVDLFVANRLNQRNFLYRNDGNANHWTTVILSGANSNRSAIGAKVRIEATVNGISRWQMQEVAAQTGYNSQNLHLHFGLADAPVIDSMVIDWPSGRTERFAGLSVDGIRTFTEGQGATAVRGVHPPSYHNAVLYQNFPNPFNPETSIRFSVPSEGPVTVEVFSLLGERIATLVRGSMGPGEHIAQWNAASQASGIYLCRLTTAHGMEMKKMTLLR